MLNLDDTLNDVWKSFPGVKWKITNIRLTEILEQTFKFGIFSIHSVWLTGKKAFKR